LIASQPVSLDAVHEPPICENDWTEQSTSPHDGSKLTIRYYGGCGSENLGTGMRQASTKKAMTHRITMVWQMKWAARLDSSSLLLQSKVVRPAFRKRLCSFKCSSTQALCCQFLI